MGNHYEATIFLYDAENSEKENRRDPPLLQLGEFSREMENVWRKLKNMIVAIGSELFPLKSKLLENFRLRFPIFFDSVENRSTPAYVLGCRWHFVL